MPLDSDFSWSLKEDEKPKDDLRNGNPSESRSTSPEDDGMEPIAVIGFAARLPQDATSVEGFWQMLSEGRSARTRVPKSRFNIDAFYHPDPERVDTTNARTGNFLTGDIAAFDAPFFSIQPSEVMSMDPQQRMMLETAYRALENSGLSMESVAGSKTCVYIGTTAHDYETLLLRDTESPPKYLGTGIGISLIANRISWFYDLRGSSVAVDTACSSSLNALHLACRTLRSHESNMALVGGCSLILAPDVSMIHLSNMNFFSPDGRCYSFDDRANGYAKGEGAGVVVIKLLSDALRDGDTIRAVIRATGTNQDGKTPGITQPSKNAQEQNIRATYHAGRLDLNLTKYVEAHGTGTQVGDPIEAEAISAAFKKEDDDPIYIGAVKPNIGHLEAASGVASLIKSILVLEKGLIPPNINFERPNAAIPTDKWHIKFPTQTIPWPSDGLRRASVNSFGYGGSNAHCVLDDAFNYLRIRGIEGRHCTVVLPPRPRIENGVSKSLPSRNGTTDSNTNGHTYNLLPPQQKLLIWSASDEEGLKRLATTYQAHMSKVSQTTDKEIINYLDDLSYTLSCKRSVLPWKAFAVTQSTEDLGRNLVTKLSKPVRSSMVPLLSFVFTGQGAQWAGMGSELLVHPVFDTSLRNSERYLQDLGCKWNLIDELKKDKTSSKIDMPEMAQPLCTALQVAVVDLLASWKIFPTAVTGHSSGEIAAAYCANGISHQSALKIAFYRGALAAGLAKCASDPMAMASIALSESAIAPYIKQVNIDIREGTVAIGCINSPQNVTVTGDSRCVDALITLMEKKGFFARRLQVNMAYHSSYMKKIATEYRELIKDITPYSDLSTPKANRDTPAIFSSVTGTRLPSDSFTKSDYWVTNLVSKVRFCDALSQMTSFLLSQRTSSKSGKEFLIEIGPTAALQRPVKDTIKQIPKSADIDYCSILRRDVSGQESCLEIMGQIFCNGCKVDLRPINSPTLKAPDLQLLVNLPQYPFNHSQTYWAEGRISKNFGMRKHARHELLGTPVADWNPSEPVWRNFIRVKENPWIVDHKVGDSILYPAAGMVVIAIEAIRQIASPGNIITGYRLKDVMFHRALVLSTAAEGVETRLHFRRRKDVMQESSDAYDFALYSYSSESWSSNCEGCVIVEYKDTSIDTENAKELEDEQANLQEAFESGVKICKDSVHSKQFYTNLKNFEYQFGPFFQTLERIHCNDTGEATATVRLNAWNDKRIIGDFQEHLIHPTALDGAFHLTLAAISRGGWDNIPTMVPTQLRNLWISNDLLKRTEESELMIYTKPTFSGYRETDFWIVAMNARKQAQIVVEDWRMMALTNATMLSAHETFQRYFHVEWKPDLALLKNTEIASLCEAEIPSATVPVETIADQVELVSAYFMSLIIKTTPHGPEGLGTHLQKYMEWIRFQNQRLNLDAFLSGHPDGKRLLSNEQERDQFLSEVAENSPDGSLHVGLGKNLTRVLEGKEDPLDLLFSGTLAQDFYSSPTLAMTYAEVASYIDLLAHKNPDLKICEIGAGTGAATAPILRSLASYISAGDFENDIPRFRQYTYTDISPAFFEEAKGRFQNYSNRMTYVMLDIEKDPLQQGFDTEQYDLIVCSMVLHATANLSTTLQNTRNLLKPGGKLILVELCNPTSLRVAFVFGLLPGWWLGTEEKRTWSPLLSEEDWNKALLENGFAGAEICLPDTHDASKHTFSAMISTAVDTVQVVESVRKKTIIVAESTPLQTQITLNIVSKLQSTGTPSEVVNMQELHFKDLKNTICIFLLELEAAFLADMSDEDYAALKAMIEFTDNILWVTQGCGEDSHRPELGMITGFGRAIRSESWDTKLVELAVKIESSVSDTADQIMTVYQESVVLKGHQKEMEYMQKGNKLCISRLVEAQYLTKSIDTKITTQPPEMLEFGSKPQRALKLHISSPGHLNTLHFKDDHRFDMPMADDEIEIKVYATGMNMKDVMVALGQITGTSLGSECAGVVTRTGANVIFKPGDRVLCCTTTGAFNTYARAHTTSVAVITDHISFCSAASSPVAFCAAYYALFHVACLQERESILIISGAGAVGQAAIQLAQRSRANVFTTVGSEREKDLLMTSYGIPEDHILSGKTISFARALLRISNGVDVILGSSSGGGFEAFLSSLRPFGRCVELGRSDSKSREALPHNVTYSSVDLSTVIDKAKPLMESTMKAIMALLTANPAQIVSPQPLHVYNVSEIEKAFEFMKDGEKMGKVVVEMQQESVVPIVPSQKRTYSFERNATYVIAGGLGGLGRSIVRWMIDREAKNFILLSRSGAKSKVAIELIDEMQLRGVKIAAPPCDISDPEAVSTVLKDRSLNMPPIKGCIQASMVLKDGVFDNLTPTAFSTATKPKVQGSWNLHTHLPPSLDFFLLLSSIAGITGTRGQSNYAAGNTYQDALARHRISLGQKCLSLDLGSILSIGYAAELDLSGSLEREGFVGISKADFFGLLDYCCDPSLPLQSPVTAQIVTGLEGIARLPAEKMRSLYWTQKPLFRILCQNLNDRPSPTTDAQNKTINYAAQLKKCTSRSEAEDIVVKALTQKLSSGLAIPVGDIDAEKAVYSFGVDSLVALEVRHWFAREIGADVTAVEVMGAGSLRGLCGVAAGRSGFWKDGGEGVGVGE